MQKYIAVINPRMDQDEIARVITKDIAGALFSISHQNYPMAAKLMAQVKALSKKQNRPISLIQDVSGMTDPLDMEFGLKSGVDWLVVGDPEQAKMAKKLNKNIPIIWKAGKFPKDAGVDSILHAKLEDPDAEVAGIGHIKHRVSLHVKQKILESIKHMAQHTNASAIAVSDLGEAKALSAMRPVQKIILHPKNEFHAHQASIYWGVHPIFPQSNLQATLKNRQLVTKGKRFIDATKIKHVTINSV